MSPRSRWGPIRSILAIFPIFIGAPWLALRYHHALPEPLTDLTNPITNLPQISEARIRGFARHLSEEIGYRTVGTLEHALADKWMVQQAEEMKRNCEQIVAATGRKLECEVWRQEGSGSHRFDMMQKRLYKTYVGLTNIIVRVSDGTPDGKEHSVLVNAHLDSTLPSPGAADDALSVGIMLDCMRVLVNTPDWSPRHAIIFLFNNAEESLQDGSHLFSTQHPAASTVRAIINLEAAGTTGRELLFQATSEAMIEAYSHVPRPYGTIFANDIFSSGIILSDTDFRQFEEYLNVTGLDIAIVGNSYLYHMRKDLVENIEAGVAQHMAENTLALIRHLSSLGSPLPSLTDGYARPTTVFFSYLGLFFIYSFTTAKLLYSFLLIASVVLVYMTSTSTSTLAKSKYDNLWREQGKGMVAVVGGMFGSLLVPNLVALVMQRVLGKGMSWFTNEYSAIALYGISSLLGAMISQYLLGPVREQTVFMALLLMQSSLAFVVQMVNIGSAAIFFLSGLPLFIALLINRVLAKNIDEISLLTYAVAQVLPLLSGTMLIVPIVEVFVPLTGRIGADAPAEYIIATIISVICSQALALVLPFAHRFGQRALLRGIVYMTIMTALTISIFSMRIPFDEMHQKRVFILHSENITSQERHLHIAAADAAPGFELLVNDIAKQFAVVDVPPTAIIMDDYNSDWDSLYPFSAFLAPYRVPLPAQKGYVSPWVANNTFTVSAVHDVKDFTAGTRSLTLEICHPGLIWTVIAFDAHVLGWTLDDNPPNEYARHHIKEASFYGKDTWTVDLIVKLGPNSPDGSLLVNFVGVQEKGMWPGKKAVKDEGGIAMQLFEKLDDWVERRTDGTVDALLMGCIAGAVSV